MYTRNGPTQSHTNNIHLSSSQTSQGSLEGRSGYSQQGSHQISQASVNSISNYRSGLIEVSQLFKPQQQLMNQQLSTPRSIQPTKSSATSLQQQQQPQLQSRQQSEMQQSTSLNTSSNTPVSNTFPPNNSSITPTPRLKPILKQPIISSPTATQNNIPCTPKQSGSACTPQSTSITTPATIPSTTPTTASTTTVSSDTSHDAQADKKSESMDTNPPEAPRWRRKVPGFKVNKKLKRLRMNQRLRKTLQPKNAIMVLNEMKAGVQFTFPESQGPMPNSLYVVHAELDGKTYVGQGLSKPLARQNAAENALKALLLEKMTAATMKARLDAESDGNQSADSSSTVKEENSEDNQMQVDANADDGDEVPWSSLASFALYKLFLEWHNQGTSVPVPRPGVPASPKGAKKVLHSNKGTVQKELPPNATSIHPVMLLNQMKPGLAYVEVNRVGNPPNTMFTLAVDVDGVRYIGTAKNKKDAKKIAAKSALLALYNLNYPDENKDLLEDVKMD